MTETVIAKKAANALFKEARISSAADAFSAATGIGRPVTTVLAQFSAHYGGLWVGGNAVLTGKALRFAPNALNRLVHQNGAELTLDLPLSELKRVDRRFGFVSGIVDIETDSGSFSIRCFNAQGFAEKIRAAAGL